MPRSRAAAIRVRSQPPVGSQAMSPGATRSSQAATASRVFAIRSTPAHWKHKGRANPWRHRSQQSACRPYHCSPKYTSASWSARRIVCGREPSLPFAGSTATPAGPRWPRSTRPTHDRSARRRPPISGTITIQPTSWREAVWTAGKPWMTGTSPVKGIQSCFRVAANTNFAQPYSRGARPGPS